MRRVDGWVLLTRYVGPTDRSGARILVTGPNGERGRVPYDHSLDQTGNHAAAAAECARKWWPNRGSVDAAQLVGGAMWPRGYAWVLPD